MPGCAQRPIEIDFSSVQCLANQHTADTLMVVARHHVVHVAYLTADNDIKSGQLCEFFRHFQIGATHSAVRADAAMNRGCYTQTVHLHTQCDCVLSARHTPAMSQYLSLRIGIDGQRKTLAAMFCNSLRNQ